MLYFLLVDPLDPGIKHILRMVSLGKITHGAGWPTVRGNIPFIVINPVDASTLE
jgi:hypothetical protein